MLVPVVVVSRNWVCAPGSGYPELPVAVVVSRMAEWLPGAKGLNMSCDQWKKVLESYSVLANYMFRCQYCVVGGLETLSGIHSVWPTHPDGVFATPQMFVMLLCYMR